MRKSVLLALLAFLLLPSIAFAQNQAWCDNLEVHFIILWSQEKIYLGTYGDEAEANVTSVDINFAVDGVWNNQTGITNWDWYEVYNTSLVNYNDGSNHTFTYDLTFYNYTEAVCHYSGSFNVNVYEETAIIASSWLNETHGNISVDNKGLCYGWQVTFFNETDWISSTGLNSCNSYVFYEHLDLTGIKGHYTIELNRDLNLQDYAVIATFKDEKSYPYDFTLPPQNPSWCDNLDTNVIFVYPENRVVLYFDEENPNVTSVSVNFAVDGVWNNQTGLWNWDEIYNTSIANYYDNSDHIITYEIQFFNDSTPVCYYSTSYTDNPYNKTIFVVSSWLNETHGGFTVDNKGLEYVWQVIIFYDGDMDEIYGDYTTNSVIIYSHVDLAGKSGSYYVQTDRDEFHEVLVKYRYYEEIPYDFTVFTPNITSCTSITQPGDYRLVSDISFSDGACIQIQSSNVTLDCSGHYISGDGVAISISQNYLSNITIKNCVIYNASTGIEAWGGTSNLHILNSTFYDNLEAIHVFGPEAGSYIYIESNKIYDNETKSGQYLGGIFVDAASNVFIRNNYIYIGNNTGDAIRINWGDSGCESYNISIEDNIIEGYWFPENYTCVYYPDVGDYPPMTKCQYMYKYYLGVENRGIETYDCNNVTIRGNIVRYITDRAYSIYFHSYNVLMENNTAEYSSICVWNDRGDDEENITQNITITGNVFRGCFEAALAEGLNNGFMINNIFINTSAYVRAKNATIYGNSGLEYLNTRSGGESYLYQDILYVLIYEGKLYYYYPDNYYWLTLWNRYGTSPLLAHFYGDISINNTIPKIAYARFERNISEASKTYIKVTDRLAYAFLNETPGTTITYSIGGLIQNSHYDVYIDGVKAYSLTSGANGSIEFNVTFNSPREILVKHSPTLRETLGPFFGIAVSLMVLGTFLWAWKIAKTSASIAIFAYIAIIIIASLTILSTL